MAGAARRLFDAVRQPLGLWDSRAKDAVLAGLLAAMTASDATEREQWRQLREFLDGLHSAKLAAVAKLSHVEDSRQWAADPSAYKFVRLVEMVGERLAVMFHTAPEMFLIVDGERLDVDDPAYGDQVLQWEQDQEDCELDTVLPTLDVDVNVMLNQVVQPCWMSDGDAEGMRWLVCDPHEVYIHQSVAAPGAVAQARSVSFSVHQPVESTGGQGPTLYSTWTREVDAEGATVYGHWVHTQDGVQHNNPLFGDEALGLADAENPYGLLPVVIWQTKRPSSCCVWIPPDEALLQDQISLDISLTDLTWGLKYYSHPQYIGKGEKPSGKLELGPGRCVWLEDNEAELTSHTPRMNILEVIQALEWLLKLTAVSRSLPPDMLNPGAARNLAALQEQRHDLTIRRRRVKPYYLRALRRTFTVHKAVGNFWAANGADRVAYSDEVQLGIKLAPIPRAEDRWQSAQARQLEVQQGLTSDIEEVMHRDAVSREEATRLVAERRERAPAVAGAPQAARPEGDQPRPASVERG